MQGHCRVGAETAADLRYLSTAATRDVTILSSFETQSHVVQAQMAIAIPRSSTSGGSGSDIAVPA